MDLYAYVGVVIVSVITCGNMYPFELTGGCKYVWVYGRGLGVSFLFRENRPTLSTVFLYAEYKEHSSSAGLPTGEWVLVDRAEGSQLGTEQRTREKEDITASAGKNVIFYQRK